ncbi:MAG: hypothetical protein U0640_12345 [Phycisphaerales bacterium]
MQTLPWKSSRARLLWSIPMVVFFVLWFLGWMLGTTTTRNTDYTFIEAIVTLRNFQVADLFKYFGFETFLIQIVYPSFYLALWYVILRPKLQPKKRKLLLWMMLVLPYWFVLIPIFKGRLYELVESLLTSLDLIAAFVGTRDGEFYEEYGLQFGVLSLIWSIPLSLLLMMRYDKQPPSCSACNYPLVGLQGNLCPECGNGVAAAERQPNH